MPSVNMRKKKKQRQIAKQEIQQAQQTYRSLQDKIIKRATEKIMSKINKGEGFFFMKKSILALTLK